MPQYVIDASLEKLANDIIDKHRPELKMLKISYMFRDKAPLSNGIVTAGMCYRQDDKQRTLHGYDFIIEIGRDLWDEATDDFKRALMDHELGHVGIRWQAPNDPEMTEDVPPRIKTYCKRHEIEEFSDVLKRHGTYHESLRNFLAAYAERNTKKKSDGSDPGDSE